MLCVARAPAGPVTWEVRPVPAVPGWVVPLVVPPVVPPAVLGWVVPPVVPPVVLPAAPGWVVPPVVPWDASCQCRAG